jgi:hypothetical protein
MPHLKQPEEAARVLLRVFHNKAIGLVGSNGNWDNGDESEKSQLKKLCADLVKYIDKLEKPIIASGTKAEKPKFQKCMDEFNACKLTPEECENQFWICLGKNSVRK